MISSFSEFGTSLGGGASYPGAVYISQQAYPTLTANPVATSPANQFYDTSGSLSFGGTAGLGTNGGLNTTSITSTQSQLVSYAGTGLVNPFFWPF